MSSAMHSHLAIHLKKLRICRHEIVQVDKKILFLDICTVCLVAFGSRALVAVTLD
jgi:hypothetical protein